MAVNAKIQRARETRRVNKSGLNLLVHELSTGAKRDIVYEDRSSHAFPSCRRDRAVFIEGFIKPGIERRIRSKYAKLSGPLMYDKHDTYEVLYAIIFRISLVWPNKHREGTIAFRDAEFSPRNAF